MRKAFFGISLVLLSCSKGAWVTEHTFRPKHPRFSILKKPFVRNMEINSQFLYVSETSYVSNNQKRIMYDFTGFYPDGRVIGISLTDMELNKISQLNTWESAPVIGHYTTQGNTIELQYFLPTDGGLYETRQGIIKNDTILLKRFSAKLRGENNRYEAAVKSGYPLGAL
jgi:hypothetical protein